LKEKAINKDGTRAQFRRLIQEKIEISPVIRGSINFSSVALGSPNKL
jgi:hypothetical protein